ncbi:MAG: extensin [Elusimicrobia bacterium]|nr:MAG: extensin [Elusimicrobiota bacterium]
MSDPRYRPVHPVDPLNAPSAASQPPLPQVTARYPGIPAKTFDRIAADQRRAGGPRYVTCPSLILDESARPAAEEGPFEVMPGGQAPWSLGGSTRPPQPPPSNPNPLEATTTASSHRSTRRLNGSQVALVPKNNRRMCAHPMPPVSAAPYYLAPPVARLPRAPAPAFYHSPPQPPAQLPYPLPYAPEPYPEPYSPPAFYHPAEPAYGRQPAPPAHQRSSQYRTYPEPPQPAPLPSRSSTEQPQGSEPFPVDPNSAYGLRHPSRRLPPAPGPSTGPA